MHQLKESLVGREGGRININLTHFLKFVISTVWKKCTQEQPREEYLYFLPADSIIELNIQSFATTGILLGDKFFI